MIERILVASLHFSPGHLSHILALKRLLLELKYDVDILLDCEYKCILRDSKEENVFYDRKSLASEYKYVFLQNPSPKNFEFTQFSRAFLKSRVFYIYHEPWDSISNYLREGIKQTIKMFIVHCINSKTVKAVDRVLVPSENAKRLYLRYDKKYNTNMAILPLLFEDETEQFPIDINEKVCFSYIGHAVKGHAFQEYLNFAKYMISQEKKMNTKFLITTRTDLSRTIRKNRWMNEAISNCIIECNHGKALTNEEINESYLRSYCVWNVYKRSTQSGVIPKSFMFGTPVVATKNEANGQLVIPGVSGEFVESGVNVEEIRTTVNKIRNNLQPYIQGSRKVFSDFFYFKNKVSEVKELINSSNQ